MLAGTSDPTAWLLDGERDAVGPGDLTEWPGDGCAPARFVAPGPLAWRCPATAACRAACPLVPKMSKMLPSKPTANRAAPSMSHRDWCRSANGGRTRRDALAEM